MGLFGKPQSRNEAILQNMLGANNQLEPPQSRVEKLLLKILENGGGGGGGGTGDGSLSQSLTTSVDVGGIHSGTTYYTGAKFEKIFRDMLSPLTYPTLTNPSAVLSAAGSKILETGSTSNVTMTVSFNRGSINPAYGTSGNRSGNATGYSLNGGTVGQEASWNATVSESAKNFQATVTYAAGEQPKDSEGNNYSTPLAACSVDSNIITYEFVDALWANTTNVATVAKQELLSKSAGTKTFVFPAQTAANPEIFDVPASWTVTAVEVLNELNDKYEDCSAEFSQSAVTHANAGGQTVNYIRYTDNRGYAASGRTIRIKWN